MLDKDGKLPRIKGGTDGRCSCNYSWSSTRNFYNNNIRRECFWCNRRRTYRFNIPDNSDPVWNFPLFLSPIFLAIPSFATAPALIIVGFYMLSNVAGINFSDYSEGIPCFICIAAMPFCYSISEGIALGIIAYVVLNLVTGKAKEKKLNLLLYILAIIFIVKECSSLFF